MAGESSRFEKKIQDFFWSIWSKLNKALHRPERPGIEVPLPSKRFCLNCQTTATTSRSLDVLAARDTTLNLGLRRQSCSGSSQFFRSILIVINIDTFRADSNVGG